MLIWFLYCELYVGVLCVDVMQKLLTVFYLLDDKGVISIPKSKPWWIGGSADIPLDSNSSMNKLATIGLMGENMAVPWICS